MDFVTSHFGKMNLAIANPSKSDDKYVEKSVQLVRGCYKIHTLVKVIYTKYSKH